LIRESVHIATERRISVTYEVCGVQMLSRPLWGHEIAQEREKMRYEEQEEKLLTMKLFGKLNFPSEQNRVLAHLVMLKERAVAVVEQGSETDLVWDIVLKHLPAHLGAQCTRVKGTIGERFQQILELIVPAKMRSTAHMQQGKGETIRAYATRFRLAAGMEGQKIDGKVVMYTFLKGLTDKSLAAATLASSDEFDKLVDKCAQLEDFKQAEAGDTTDLQMYWTEAEGREKEREAKEESSAKKRKRETETGGKTARKEDRECYRCGEKGHIQRFCNKKEGEKKKKQCRVCKRKNHETEDCREIDGLVEIRRSLKNSKKEKDGRGGQGKTDSSDEEPNKTPRGEGEGGQNKKRKIEGGEKNRTRETDNS
jgi:hypothetical protein